MTNGIVNVYKEKGFTSFDVVAKMRGIFHQKKVGHTGTLDPDAEGVLPVCLGSATKVCELLADKDKEYEAVLLLGTETDTQDISGQVLAECPVTVTEEEAAAAIACFTGRIMQVPPMYSALKVNGKKLCDLARQGVTIERSARPVTIHRIEILSMELPRVHVHIHCSKGTYIRTLCHDIGRKLGCGGCMESLCRTRVSEFTAEEALTLAEIEKRVQSGCYDFVRSADSVFLSYPAVTAAREARKLIDNGNRIPRRLVANDPPAGSIQVRLYDDMGHFIGLYVRTEAEEDYRPIKLFFDR